jgi:DNA helicase IV
MNHSQNATAIDLRIINALEFNKIRNGLLFHEVFLSRKDYQYLKSDYADLYIFFKNAKELNAVENFSKKNEVDPKIIYNFIEYYEHIDNDVKTHNKTFINKSLISHKEYLDKILKDVDSKIFLDDDQRRVILNDEDYTLVIAGAGAGKTTTVAAKVKYLIDKKNLDPSEILVISYTNKAVDELKERINKQLKISCPITTFHAAGNAIIRKQKEEKLRIVDSGFLYNIARDYLKKNILNHKEMMEKVIMFFGTYFDAPYEGEDLKSFFNYIIKADFTTIKSELNEYTIEIIDRLTKKQVTINNESLRSQEEVLIANFLYTHGIDYTYEPIYPFHISGSRKIYTPDFLIVQGDKKAYIEHFGITESGEHSRYTKEELETYIMAKNHKINLHRKHNTNLIISYSQYNDGKSTIDHLEKNLISFGFNLNKKDTKDILLKLVGNEENKYIWRLVKLITIFIHNFKVKGLQQQDFYTLLRTTENVRTKLFLEICHMIYSEYQNALEKERCVDFEDMINDSARILREVAELKEKLPFKYIIVDEYQDISMQRFDLTKELSNVCDAKIIAVGDDWQSIYAFSGSDITLFTRFAKTMGYAEELIIRNTYRNAQEVIDIAGNFIQKNENQIKKTLFSPHHINDPVIVITYSDDYDKNRKLGLQGVLEQRAESVVKAIEHILNNKKNEHKEHSILLVGRYNFDAERIGDTPYFTYDSLNNVIICNKYPKVKLEFLTAHSSKGLGFDDVIIINAIDHVYGFPSQIEIDPALQLVINVDASIEYAEERRLFYVAMTRTKNRVYIVTPEKKTSEFVTELINDYQNVKLEGVLQENIKEFKHNTCPICGYPLTLKYKPSYGLKLYICTNEPEACGFMTNNLRGGKMSISKCPKCIDGYMIVKGTRRNDESVFLGCTNYSTEGNGCDYSMSKIRYYEMNHLNDDKPEIIHKKNIDSKQKETNHDFQHVEIQSKIMSADSVVLKEQINPLVDIIDESKHKQIIEKPDSIKPKLSDDLISVNELNTQLNIYQLKILKCVDELVTKRGINKIADILIQSKAKYIIDNNLDKLSSYGSLLGYKKDVIIEQIHSLIEGGYITQTTGLYPILTLNEKGKLILQSQGKKLDYVADSIEEMKVLVNFDQNNILKNLRSTRKHLATEKGIVPRRYIKESLLKRIARKPPKDIEHFSKMFVNNSNVNASDIEALFESISSKGLLEKESKIQNLHDLIIKSSSVSGVCFEINNYLLSIGIMKKIKTNDIFDYLEKEGYVEAAVKKDEKITRIPTEKGIGMDIGIEILFGKNFTSKHLKLGDKIKTQIIKHIEKNL